MPTWNEFLHTLPDNEAKAWIQVVVGEFCEPHETIFASSAIFILNQFENLYSNFEATSIHQAREVLQYLRDELKGSRPISGQ